jgi:mono/diheme cytochrome c family protein
MRTVLLGVLIGAVAVLLVTFGLYARMGRRAAAALDRRFDVAAIAVDIPRDSASIAEGERLGWLVGCHSCHADSLQGKIFVDEPNVMRLIAPNVARSIAPYSNAELGRLIREGVKRDGRGTVAMPAAALHHMSDADVGRLVASLRQLPNVASDSLPSLPPTELRVFGKYAASKGSLVPDAATIDHSAPRLGNRVHRSPAERGEYLSRLVCAECHGATLMGSATSPALIKAMGYRYDEFVSLMLDGRSRDGRDLALMGKAARARFVRFTRDEIAAIYAWLQVMPAHP